MPKKILTVEDDQEASQLLTTRLTAAGYEVINSFDATFAIKEAQAQKPDLILLDLMLPGGGGLGVLERLKLSVYTNKIPVIGLTGMTDEDYKEKVRQFGVKTIIQKPYDAKDLLAEIDRAPFGRETINGGELHEKGPCCR